MFSADHSVSTLMNRKPNTPDIFSIYLNIQKLLAYFVTNHYFHFSGTPSDSCDRNGDKSELARLCLWIFYGYQHNTNMCVGPKIISQGIILTL